MTIPPSAPIQCLLVDDIEDNLLVLEALLRRDGLKFLKAQSGQEALEILLKEDVALALIDVQMPEMDGFELAELMRGTERTRNVPIIFVTAGMPERPREFRGYDAGAVDFLFKPIEPRILRHKAETFFQLYRQRQVLAETLRLNEELMAVVGHDLRNPLNVVLMVADLLSKSSKEKMTLDVAVRLRSSGQRMQQIIDELLDLSRARLSGGIPIERGQTDLGVVAKKIVAETEAAHPSRVVTLHEEGDLRGAWDEGRLAQVLSNLVGNAVRHGTDEPIVIRIGGKPDEVLVSVHNGGHIPADLIPRLFEPFHSGQGKRARAEGLGLGLYIVEQIVLAHGGRVTVQSTEAEGTTFQVALPRR